MKVIAMMTARRDGRSMRLFRNRVRMMRVEERERERRVPGIRFAETPAVSQGRQWGEDVGRRGGGRDISVRSTTGLMMNDKLYRVIDASS
jgi:hypothetical protein